MVDNKRVDEIDILKALGIICMVAGHSDAPFTRFIYLFHMAVFFIASGFFYKDSSTNSINNVIKTIRLRIKNIWWPYFAWNAIFVILNNAFVDLNIYTNNEGIRDFVTGSYIRMHSYMTVVGMLKNIIKSFWFSGGTTLGGAFWFLKALFLVSVCYVIGDYLLKRFFKINILLLQGLLSMALLLFGYWCSKKGIMIKGLEIMASTYFLYYLGHLLGINRKKYTNFDRRQWIMILIVSIGILLWLNNYGSVDIGNNRYCDPLFLMATSFAGWCFLYSIASILKETVFKRILIFIGQRTISVVILHFAAMKIVALIVCMYYRLPFYCIAAHPNLYGDIGLWWLAYTVIGMAIPVLFNIAYKKIENKIRVQVHNNLQE